MNEPIPNGTEKIIDGRPSVYFYGYWIRYYDPPKESLAAKKVLIDHLRRRLFHHTEAGINTPGQRLDMARTAYEQEQNPARKRVNAAMLAGALFNRATDIFTSVVALEEKGVTISPQNELVRACGEYFKEALVLGKNVRHYSGHEGIDELWGEPFKAFSMPIKEFYQTRYIKIAQAMSNLDCITDVMVNVFKGDLAFSGVDDLIREYGEAAKLECETMRSDEAIFQVWPTYVAASEALMGFSPNASQDPQQSERQTIAHGMRLLRDGRDLIRYVTGARVPMPKSTEVYLEQCEEYRLARSPANVLMQAAAQS